MCVACPVPPVAQYQADNDIVLSWMTLSLTLCSRSWTTEGKLHAELCMKTLLHMPMVLRISNLLSASVRASMCASMVITVDTAWTAPNCAGSCSHLASFFLQFVFCGTLFKPAVAYDLGSPSCVASTVQLQRILLVSSRGCDCNKAEILSPRYM